MWRKENPHPVWKTIWRFLKKLQRTTVRSSNLPFIVFIEIKFKMLI